MLWKWVIIDYRKLQLQYRLAGLEVTPAWLFWREPDVDEDLDWATSSDSSEPPPINSVGGDDEVRPAEDDDALALPRNHDWSKPEWSGVVCLLFSSSSAGRTAIETGGSGLLDTATTFASSSTLSNSNMRLIKRLPGMMVACLIWPNLMLTGSLLAVWSSSRGRLSLRCCCWTASVTG